MVSLSTPAADPPADVPRPVRSRPTGADRIFRGTARTAAVSVLVIMGMIALFLFLRAVPALRSAGAGFLTEQEWQVAAGVFGIAAALTGTVLIAAVALTIAVPVALATALFISEYAPRRMRRPLISLIDLMAAVPSIVYGLWGFFFLQPRIIDLSRWLSDHLGPAVPFLRVEGLNDGSAVDLNTLTSSTFIAGVVVAMMVVPIACSVMREVFSQAPPGEREAAIALGSTQWGMIRTVVLPFGRAGIIGGVMLGLGRALGETIAVLLIISLAFDVGPLLRILQGNGNSISALIASRYQEASDLNISALMAAGLVLFLITLAVNALASVIISRSRSGTATEI